MSVINPGCYLYFWPTGYKSEGPKTPSLGSINLLEWLTELRKPIYSLDCLFIIKGYNSDTQWNERDASSKGWGKGMELPSSLWACHYLQISKRSLTQKLSKPCPLGVLWRLHYIVKIDKIIGPWWSIQPPGPLPFLEVRGSGWGETESANLLITWLVLLATSPHP